MKYIIDTDVCKKEDISVGAALYLVSLYSNSPIDQSTMKELWNKGYVLVTDMLPDGTIKKLSPNKSGLAFVDSILEDSSNKKVDDSRYLTLASKLIELYPKGKKPGTNYMWRDSQTIIAKRLKNLFVKNNVKATDEQVVSATERYVNSYKNDNRYMQLLKYFISKKTLIDGNIEENSQLLSYLENTDDSLPIDWTTDLR